jgi:choline dehydrogenase-like flavoprotein
MLGVAEAKQTFVADELLRQAVDEETGRGYTFSRHRLPARALALRLGQADGHLLVMQPVSNFMRLRLRRGPWGRRLASETGDGERPPTSLPIANRLAQRMAEKMHGTPGSVLLEVLASTSSTAHILGGATMGRTPAEGVCDERGRVFGYENLWVADGSLVPANLGVNPARSPSPRSPST